MQGAAETEKRRRKRLKGWRSDALHPDNLKVFEDAPHCGSQDFRRRVRFRPLLTKSCGKGVHQWAQVPDADEALPAAAKTTRGCVLRMKRWQGRRAAFVCDRTTLINQTSDVGIQLRPICAWRDSVESSALQPKPCRSRFGVSRRWRAAIGRRRMLIIIDEAHTMYAAGWSTSRRVQQGYRQLSATPFSPGWKLFRSGERATMHELTQWNSLVPKCGYLSCTTADMTGAGTANNEWTDKGGSRARQRHYRDVVSRVDQVRRGPQDHRCSGPTIAYCAKLCQQFNDARIMAATFTGETRTTSAKRCWRAYRKPNSRIPRVDFCRALAKSSMSRDVSCVVDCRPLPEICPAAIQMMGTRLRCSPEPRIDCLLLDAAATSSVSARTSGTLYFSLQRTRHGTKAGQR